MRKQKKFICPQCKSANVDFAIQLGGANMGGGDHYYCKNCRYGEFKHVVFDEIDEKKIKQRTVK